MGSMVRFRLGGHETAVRCTLTALRDIADLDSIEEVDARGKRPRDDATSACMAHEFPGEHHDIEIHAMTDGAASQLRERLVHAARAHGIALQFVERF